MTRCAAPGSSWTLSFRITSSRASSPSLVRFAGFCCVFVVRVVCLRVCASLRLCPLCCGRVHACMLASVLCPLCLALFGPVSSCAALIPTVLWLDPHRQLPKARRFYGGQQPVHRCAPSLSLYLVACRRILTFASRASSIGVHSRVFESRVFDRCLLILQLSPSSFSSAARSPHYSLWLSRLNHQGNLDRLKQCAGLYLFSVANNRVCSLLCSAKRLPIWRYSFASDFVSSSWLSLSTKRFSFLVSFLAVVAHWSIVPVCGVRLLMPSFGCAGRRAMCGALVREF